MNDEILRDDGMEDANVNVDDNIQNEHDNIPSSDEKVEIPTMKVIPLKKICMTIGQLPTAYIETMSYYEMLVWFIEYLKNNIIPTVNNNAEAVQEVQTIVMTLQGYINNYKETIDSEMDNFQEAVNKDIQELEDYMNDYFNNLDVQEEINNKLNQMLEDGVLTEIIHQFLQSTAIWCFDNVADMKQATNLVNGSYARTLGYYSANDGGEATYKITDTKSETDYQEELKSGLYATLIINEFVIPETFGAYGDGVHNDTDVFKNIISFLNNKNYVLSGKGTYLLNEQITINNINIYMPYATIINPYGLIITAENKNLNLPKILSNETRANATAITLLECYSCNITINYIKGFENGLLLTANTNGCVYNLISILEIRNCINSIVLQNTENGWVNENTFIKGRIFNESNFQSEYASEIVLISLLGSSTRNCNNNYFLNTCIEGNEGSSNGLKIKLRYASFNHFESLRYEGTDPKIDALNSLYNVINGGYGVNNLSFVNDKVNTNYNNSSYLCNDAGRLKGVYQDIRVTSNSNPILRLRGTNGDVASELMAGSFNPKKSDGTNNAYSYSNNGVIGYDTDNSSFTILRNYGKHVVTPNCDGTNHCYVISPSANTLHGCFLWVYDGHLYGKMGQPSNETDGTAIL